MKKRLASCLATLMAGSACAQAEPEAAWSAAAGQLATQSAQAALGPRSGVRLEVVPGTLDPRLKLAPCRHVEPYLPPGQPAWGRTRIGLRCADGAVAWNVYLPVTVKVFAPALVATQSLPAGTLLRGEHLQVAEADWAGADSPVVQSAALALGRVLARPWPAGSALRDADLKKRQWFAVGDPVRVVAAGPGFSVSGDGLALTPGIEGQPARVRTETGRTVTGLPTGERRVELPL